MKTRFFLVCSIALLFVFAFITTGCEDLFGVKEDKEPISGLVLIYPPNPFVGDDLTVSTQLFPPGPETYRWERADTQEGPWIFVRSSVNYILTQADQEKYIRVTVKQVNRSGSITSNAVYIRVRTPLTGSVYINGNAIAGETLTAITGGLGGSGDISYQWERTVSTNANSWRTVGTNSYSYTISPDDAGKYIRLTVTRADNTGSITSEMTDAVLGAPLAGTVYIRGTAAVGENLTAIFGSLGPNRSYQWECADTADSAEWIAIGDNNIQYTLVEADQGKYIRLTMTSADNSGSVSSKAVGPVDFSALEGTVSIEGTRTVIVGDVLTADTSLLLGSGEISYQWKKFKVVNNVVSTTSVDIGDNAPEYIVDVLDTGYQISVTVTRSENRGSVTSNKTKTIVITQLVGLDVKKPAVTVDGDYNIDSVLTANTDNLGGSGEITYKWERRSGGSGTYNSPYKYTTIGSNSDKYTPTSEDVGGYVRVTVTRAGNIGSVSSSVNSNPITNNLVGIVIITGDTAIGETLTAETDLLPPGKGYVTYTYRWDNGGSSVGNNSKTYKIVGTDSEKNITVTVSRSDRTGSVRSISTDQVYKPPLTGTVSINGTAAVGENLTAVTSLDGSGIIGYQWQVGDTATGPWTDIFYTTSNNISSTYAPVFECEGRYIRVIVTRAYNEESVSSDATDAVFKRELTVGTVSITGSCNVDSTLTAVTTNFNGSGDYIYQWERCDTATGEWTDIDEGNTKTYKLVWDDFEKIIRVTVSRSNNLGSISSGATSDIGIPILSGSVSISGTAREGEKLTADTRGLGGSGAITYLWERASSASGPWSTVGDNSDSYNLTSIDVNNFIRLTVSRAGTTGNYSVTTSRVVPPLLTGTVSISGTAKAGQSLTANTSGLEGTGAVYIQWQRSDTANASVWNNIVNNSTPTTYIPVASDAGKYIRVSVSRSDRSGSVTSNATSAVTVDPISGAVSISGTAKAGVTLIANANNLGGTGTIYYQWQRGDTANATVWTNIGSSSAYTPNRNDAQKYIRVKVSSIYHSGEVISNVTSAVAIDPLTGSVTISRVSGSPTLRAEIGNLKGSGDITYKWERTVTLTLGVLTGSWSTVGSSQYYTYTILQTFSYYRVTVTRAHNSGSITSGLELVLFGFNP